MDPKCFVTPFRIVNHCILPNKRPLPNERPSYCMITNYMELKVLVFLGNIEKNDNINQKTFDSNYKSI